MIVVLLQSHRLSTRDPHIFLLTADKNWETDKFTPGYDSSPPYVGGLKLSLLLVGVQCKLVDSQVM